MFNSDNMLHIKHGECYIADGKYVKVLQKRLAAVLRLDTMSHMLFNSNSPNSGSKRCSSCLRNLPFTQYGFTSVRRDARTNLCKQCAQDRQRKLRFRVSPPYMPHAKIHIPILHLIHHNKRLLTELLQNESFSGFAYSITDRKDLTFTLTKNQDSITFSCPVLHYSSSCGLTEFISNLCSLLKLHAIRLEETELDLINIKTILYYV